MSRRIYEVGFTGTSRQLTDLQVQNVIHLFSVLGNARLHHGDCVGADAKAHEIARELHLHIVAHPPVNPVKRAYCYDGAVTILPPKTYRERNRDIVIACNGLVCCPGSDHELIRSGEWMTVRLARIYDRPITILYPNGDEKHERGGVLG